MPGTIVHQYRTASSTDAGALYSIAASCIAPGTLPDTAIFLLEAVTATDPKDDVLKRICSPADFGNYGTVRDLAAESNGLYRGSAYTLKYAGVEAANAAWQTLSGRINTLVNEFDTFLTAFLTQDEGVETQYPTVDLSQKTVRIATYKTRVAAVVAAQTARDEHQRACRDVKAAALLSVQQELSQATADLAAMRTVRSVADVLAASYPSATATISAAATAAGVATTASSASTGEKAAINAQLATVQTAVSSLVGYDTRLVTEVQTPLAAFVGTLEARVAALTQGLGTAQSELAACDIEMSRLQGELDESRRARDAALADVRAICPDFVPLLVNDETLAAALTALAGEG